MNMHNIFIVFRNHYEICTSLFSSVIAYFLRNTLFFWKESTLHDETIVLQRSVTALFFDHIYKHL